MNYNMKRRWSFIFL